MELAREIRTGGAHVAIEDESGVGEARRRAAALASRLELTEEVRGRIGLVSTELARNLVRHAGGGHLTMRGTVGGDGMELLSVDTGPGMEDVDRCLRDGFSTAGGPGTGLGAVKRTSERFQIYSDRGKGTVVAARVEARARDRPGRAWDVGALNVPYPGEAVSGDSWGVVTACRRTLFFVVDGLGHGAAASEASRAAVDSLYRHASLGPAGMLDRTNEEIRGTRGAAAAVLEVSLDDGAMRFAGVGNIVCAMVPLGDRPRTLVSAGGILGHAAYRIREESGELVRDALVVMHSDGLSQRWNFEEYPGLPAHAAELVAGVLFRDWWRGRDDAGVLVARRTRR